MKGLKAIGFALLLAHGSGCATIIFPKRVALPEENRAGLDWDMVMSDILCTGGLGLIVDFIHGTIYRPMEGYSGRGYDRGFFTKSGSPAYPGPGP